MVGGNITINDVLMTVINGVTIPYQVVAGDTTVTILATHIVSAINATTKADPITGLPLEPGHRRVERVSVITFKAVNPGSSFRLACSLSSGATETYVTLDHDPALRSAFNLTGDEYDPHRRLRSATTRHAADTSRTSARSTAAAGWRAS